MSGSINSIKIIERYRLNNIKEKEKILYDGNPNIRI